MDDFEKEIKAAFLEEAAQNLSDAEQCFLDLEKNSSDKSILEKIFRLAHNLKGSGKAVGFDELGAFTHVLESLLLKIKNGHIQITPGIVDLLLRCNDHLNLFVTSLKADFSAHVDSSGLLGELQSYIDGQVQQEAPVTKVSTPDVSIVTPIPETEVAPTPAEVAMLEHAANQEQQSIEASSSFAESPPSPQSSMGQTAKPKENTTDESIRVSLHRLESLLNFVGEMVILQSVLREQVGVTAPVLTRRTVHQLGKVTKEIQDISMSLRMVPVKQTFQKMQRIVRDTSRTVQKDVEFHMSGEETELDKTVLEQLGDPLVHLIRNAVDHGLETPDERRLAGKSQTGHVYLSASHKVGQIVIEVRDDGKGLDPKKLIASAIKKGVIKSGEGLTDEQAHRLVFAPGFSTKEQVTDVSGRGVGMDVVKTNIERLHGEIQIETALGKGTTFRIRLPVTLAIIDGMVVKQSGDRFVIPLSHAYEAVQVLPEQIQKNAGLGETLILRGENLPLFRLDFLLGRSPSAKTETQFEQPPVALIIRALERPFAVMVDQILNQQQIVIKPMGPELKKLKGFGGSAILGDGLPALILELPELIRRLGPLSHRPADKSNQGVAV